MIDSVKQRSNMSEQIDLEAVIAFHSFKAAIERGEIYDPNYVIAYTEEKSTSDNEESKENKENKDEE